MSNNKTSITLTLERLDSGGVRVSGNIQGKKAFKYFEIVGALECFKQNLVDKARTTAEHITDDTNNS